MISGGSRRMTVSAVTLINRPASAARWVRAPHGLLDNASRVGTHLKGALARELGALKGVVEIRGQGLMLGVELAKPCGALTQRAADAGLLISVTADTVVRLLPPLIMTEQQADDVVAVLAPLVRDFLSE